MKKFAINSVHVRCREQVAARRQGAMCLGVEILPRALIPTPRSLFPTVTYTTCRSVTYTNVAASLLPTCRSVTTPTCRSVTTPTCCSISYAYL
ncbi:hypothetical protein, partial [Legionella wadsworthii]